MSACWLILLLFYVAATTYVIIKSKKISREIRKAKQGGRRSTDKTE